MSEFAVDINRFIKKAAGNADQIVRKVCFDIERGIVQATPEDTGRLRANWIASVDSPFSGMSSSTGTPNNDNAIQQAPGRIWYLTNNLPYAAVVEFGQFGRPPGSANGPKTINGFSSQAPAGMVRVTLARFGVKPVL